MLVAKLVEAARFLVLAALSACGLLMQTLATRLFIGTYMLPHRTSWPARESVVVSPLEIINFGAVSYRELFCRPLRAPQQLLCVLRLLVSL